MSLCHAVLVALWGTEWWRQTACVWGTEAPASEELHPGCLWIWMTRSEPRGRAGCREGEGAATVGGKGAQARAARTVATRLSRSRALLSGPCAPPQCDRGKSATCD